MAKSRPAVRIRQSKLADLPALTEIYNEAILTTTATFDIEPKTIEDRRAWFESHGPRHPILVAEVDGQVAGWGCLTKWSDRPAYDDTAETSFYVVEKKRGQGIGRAIKGALIHEARRLGFHTLIARVAEGSEPSRHLNKSFGFIHIGTMKEVGRKFNRLLDVHLLQIILD